MAIIEANRVLRLPSGRILKHWDNLLSAASVLTLAQSSWSERISTRGALVVGCMTEATSNPGAGLVVDFGFFPFQAYVDGDRKVNPTTDMRWTKRDGPNNWQPKGILHFMLPEDTSGASNASANRWCPYDQCSFRFNNGGAGTLTAAVLHAYAVF